MVRVIFPNSVSLSLRKRDDLPSRSNSNFEVSKFLDDAFEKIVERKLSFLIIVETWLAIERRKKNEI